MSRPISNKLRIMLEEINQAFGHAAKVVLEAYNQAIVEGFSPNEAKDLIFENVKNISRRTIYYYLPEECKDKRMQQVAFHKRSVQNCTDTVKDENNNNLASDKDEIQEILDTRKLTPQILGFSAMLDEKDKIIDKHKKEIIELKKINKLKENLDSNWLILHNEHAERIYLIMTRAKEKGRNSEFALGHDGRYVTSIEELMDYELNV